MARLVVGIVFAAGLALSAAVAPPAEGPLSGLTATIHSQNDVPIAAEAEGVIIELPVREGSQVAVGDVLAAIDDRQAKAAVEVAKFALEAATEKANDTIEEDYAKAAFRVAKQKWLGSLRAKDQVNSAVSDIQLEEEKLEAERAELQIKKAKKDRVIAGKEAAVKQAELGAQQVTLERHAMRARFAGEVQQLFKHQAEWARPGDPILRLVQFDVLYADVLVNSREHAPGELRGKPATLTVQQASGNQAVEGRITYVDQTVIEASEGGAFLVRAEIQNRQENGSWIVRPGLTAKLTIHVDQPAVVK